VETRRGIAVSPGVAIGPARIVESQGAQIARKFVMPDEAPREIARFDKALTASQQEIHELAEGLRTRLDQQVSVSDIFQVHLGILEDPKLRHQITNLITHRLFTAEFAVQEILRRYITSLQEAGDSYLLQRVRDFEDIGQRLLRNLQGETHQQLARAPGPVVIVAHDLTPSQTAGFDKEKVLGIATEAGGRTSHTAILARALGIPAVVGAAGLINSVVDGDMLIVDGSQGAVVITPDEATRQRYQARGRTFEVIEERTAAEFCNLPAVTLDGRAVIIEANIEFPNEVATVLNNGASGVGLYRTEFLYHTAENPPDEEAHFQAYMEAIRALKDHPMTIRILDLGADKFPSGFPERNPFLGCRSMRLLRLQPTVFRNQIRAILRASAMGKLRFMFPMIANLAELREARKVVTEVMEEFDAAGAVYDKKIQVGIMIEVPSAAMTADLLAEESDFFSIGTNDLVQYTLAVDRDNERVAHLYSPVDPAVLRLIQRTVQAGQKAGIRVSMCGEMAGDIMHTILLVGMGFESLSMAPSVIPDVKKLIRSIRYEGAKKIADHALSLKTAKEVEQYLSDETRKVVPELVQERQPEG